MDLRERACRLLRARNIPIDYETIVHNADVHYETAVRTLLSGKTLDEALGITQVEDSIVTCKCGSKKVLEQSIQTRSADESATSFYYCVKCTRNWKI